MKEFKFNEVMEVTDIKDLLYKVSEKFGDERKTEIQDVEDEIDIEDLKYTSVSLQTTMFF